MMMTMQGAVCCSSFSTSSLILPFQTRLSPALAPSKLHLKPLCCNAAQGLVSESSERESGFVEVGYLSNVHGLQGEICVKPSTDFPELRFSNPGKRWLRQQVSGKDNILEVELVEGRGGHPGQKSWILSFGGIDTVEEARQLVGSTLLVREDDRPELKEGEFYSRDLVGIRVNLKESGECVGTVVNVFDSGAGDLLQVMLNPSVDVPEGSDKSMSNEQGVLGPLVWVPFVEAIVPEVDMIKREMWITPPKGLLELNIRTDERSKKERRQLEWKERKKNQRRLITAKKKLSEMDQKHVFDGLRFGEKSERSLLAEEIVGVNSKLLQQALKHVEVPAKRWTRTELINATRANVISSSLKLSKKGLTPHANGENLPAYSDLQENGMSLLSKGKVGIVLVVHNVKEVERSNSPDVVDSSDDSIYSLVEKTFSDDQTFLQMEDRAVVPLVLVCPMQEIQSLEEMFSNNDYFGFDSEKVWILEEEKFPVVTSSEEGKYKILMKTPWEILQTTVGSGGVFNLLAAHNIPENLHEMGIEYIEVCSVDQNNILGNVPLLGFVNMRKAELGVRISDDAEGSEECFDMIFSMSFMKKLIKQMDKLQFDTISKANSHVNLVNKEWIDIIPSTPNSYQFSCSIYSAINLCSLDKICVMELTD